MNPPVEIEITLLLLGVVAIALFQYVAYTEVKKRGYRITRRQILRLEMIVLKPAIIYTSRFVLLTVVMILPLAVLIPSTELSIVFVMDSLLGKVWSPLPGSPLPVGIEIAISFLYLIANIILMHYFLGKYGSAYKLPVMFFTRDDVKQLFKKHQNVHKALQDVLSALIFGSVAYVAIVMTLFVALINSPSILLKIDIGIVITLLLGYVLPNKKYENVIKLIEKIWR